MEKTIKQILELARSLAEKTEVGTATSSRYLFTNAVTCLFMAGDYLRSYFENEERLKDSAAPKDSAQS